MVEEVYKRSKAMEQKTIINTFAKYRGKDIRRADYSTAGKISR